MSTAGDDMPQSKQTLEQRLAKFKISLQRYQTECCSLLSAGFSAEQADRLIIRGSSSNTVQAVLNNCRDLLIAPYHLTHEQITTIAGHGGGSKNIEAVKAAFTELRDLGFTPAQIVTIAGHIGGSKNIEAVKAAFTELRELGFIPAQIVTIAGHDGGSKNIYAVQTYFQELRANGHSIESITATASRNGGSGAIRSAVGQNFRAFLLNLGAIPSTNTATPLASLGVFSSRDYTGGSADGDDEEPEDSPQPNKRRKF